MVERELVGGLCTYWGCIPSKTLLRPGEAVEDARQAAATADVDVKGALDWRDYMVSKYSDDTQVRWLATHRVDLIGGAGGWPGRVWSRLTECAIPPLMSSSPPVLTPSSPLSPACASSKASGPTGRRPP